MDRFREMTVRACRTAFANWRQKKQLRNHRIRRFKLFTWFFFFRGKFCLLSSSEIKFGLYAPDGERWLKHPLSVGDVVLVGFLGFLAAPGSNACPAWTAVERGRGKEERGNR